MKTENFLKILFLGLAITLQSFSGPSNGTMKASDFLKILKGATKFQSKITGKNNGPFGQACYIEIIEGAGRSAGFQTSLKITETNIYGALKTPMQINVFNSVQGVFSDSRQRDGLYQSFKYTQGGVTQEIIIYTNGRQLALTLSAMMGVNSRLSYCFVP